MSEYDTHFQGVALLMDNDLYDMYSNLVIAEQDMWYRTTASEVEQMREDIRSYLAERLSIIAQQLYQAITE